MSDIGLGDARPKKAKQPKRRAPVELADPNADEEFAQTEEWEQQRRAEYAESVDTRGGSMYESAPTLPSPPANANPYAPTGWRKKQRVEFDCETPTGQLCRVMRLERDDLIRLNLLEELNTFAPKLLDKTITDEERERQMQNAMNEDPAALGKMMVAIDKVVMAATVNPKITDQEGRVNYDSSPAVVLISDIDTFDRMYIFGESFGRSMDDLKSVFRATEGMDGLANVPGVQQNTE